MTCIRLWSLLILNYDKHIINVYINYNYIIMLLYWLNVLLLNPVDRDYNNVLILIYDTCGVPCVGVCLVDVGGGVGGGTPRNMCVCEGGQVLLFEMSQDVTWMEVIVL